GGGCVWEGERRGGGHWAVACGGRRRLEVPIPRPPSFPELPLLLRWRRVLGAGSEEADVLRILLIEDLRARAKVRTHQFIGGTIEIAELEMTLAEPKVEERVADRARTAHGVREVVAPGLVVAAEEVGVTGGSKNPGRCFPVDLRLRKQIPRRPVLLERLGVALCAGVFVAERGQTLDVGVDGVRKFSHRRGRLPANGPRLACRAGATDPQGSSA